MFLTMLTSALFTLWVILCLAVYGYYYLVDVLLDSPVIEQSPCTAHTNLKQIIEKLLQETLHLPYFKKAVEHPASYPDEKERTYEELLATAILNKVITKCQSDLPSSSTASVSSRVSTSSKYKDGKEYFFGEKTLENKWKHTDLETTSNSSLDEYLHSDSSLGSTKYVDRVSLTIQQRIEELSPSDVEDNVDVEDDYIGKNSFFLGNEDSNWYLQKRQFQGTHSPIPVPMLVPNPVTTAKVLIGDREIDDTSDLSDAISDYDDLESATGIQNLTIESKVVIGGKNLISKLPKGALSDEETSVDSGVKEDRDDFSEKEKDYNIRPKTDITVDDENVEDASLISLHSNIERDSEYIEKYASLPRTIVRTPSLAMKPPSAINRPHTPDEYETLSVEKRNEEKTQVMEEILIDDTVFEGSYSKKEKEKWSRPITMQNNPYSTENIEKRIRSSQIFGRDYYTKQAGLPSGRSKSDKNDNSFWPPRTPSFEGEEEKTDLYRAVPVASNDDDFEIQETINPVIMDANENNSHNFDVTSDSDLSLVNCYDVENFKVYHQSSDGSQKEIYVQVNTEGLLYNPLDEENTIIVDQDISKKEETLDVPKIMDQTDVTEYDDNYNIKKQNINNQSNETESETTELNTPKISPRTFINKNQQIPIAPRRTKYNGTSETLNDKNTNNENVTTDSFNVTPTIISKKSDNTLIKKIYSDPVVRSFALVNREQIPVNIDSTFEKPESIKAKVKQSEPATVEEAKPKTKDKPEAASSNLSQDEKPEELIFSNTFSLELSDNESIQRQQSTNKEYDDVHELKQKRLVASRLGQFSKSFPNLSKINLVDQNRNKIYVKKTTEESVARFDDKLKPDNKISDHESDTNIENVITEIYPSVKNLKKLFEKNDPSPYKKEKPVHSLTARSISQQMKEKLKNNKSDE